MEARPIQDGDYTDWALVKERLLTGILKGMAKGAKPGPGMFNATSDLEGFYKLGRDACTCGMGAFAIGERMKKSNNKPIPRLVEELLGLKEFTLAGFLCGWDGYFQGDARESYDIQARWTVYHLGFDLAQRADKANMFEDTDDGSFIFYWEETEEYPETCILVYKDGTVTNLAETFS